MPVARKQQFCTFLVKEQLFGVPVQQVQEVISCQEMTLVPLMPAVIRGLINLRGQIAMAVDLRRRFGIEERAESQFPTNVVLRSNEGAISLLVDEIGEVLEIEESGLEPPPETLCGTARDMVMGIYQLKDRLMQVLDIDAVCQLTEPESPGAPNH